MFANVILDINFQKLDKTFTYKVPEWFCDIAPGQIVEVPFGKGNTPKKAYVMDVFDELPIDTGIEYKTIIGKYKDKIEVGDKFIALAAFIKKNYGGTMMSALNVVMPVKNTVKAVNRMYISCICTKDELRALIATLPKNHVNKKNFLERLLNEDIVEVNSISDTGISGDSLMKLRTDGIISIASKRVYRGIVDGESNRVMCPLNDEQEKICQSFFAKYDSGVRDVSLLYGITGSGKTEVYIHMAKHVIACQKKVIILIPEISLTKQTVERFKLMFGDRLCVLHSRLSMGERFDQIVRLRSDDVDVVIGPRSALFTPVDDIGLIIIDEEHESSYRNNQVPKYDTREVAFELAKLHGASVILGSATPSMETFKRALEREYDYYELTKRAVSGAKLPDVHIVDMREEFHGGNMNVISKLLDDRIKKCLTNGEQVILFINRRGMASFVSCRDCGEVIRCPHCDVSLKLHGDNTYRCHYCNYVIKDIKACPKCGSTHIGAFRMGTEKLEERVKKMYPDARVLRLDSDSARQKGETDRIVEAFAEEKADILIGTQMVIKGHDFSNVTLMGIIAADMSLYVDNFKAGERTFQMLTQAAGRSGRGEKRGDVVIQTYSPEHYCIKTAAAQDYIGFYNREAVVRKQFGYPPFSNLLVVTVSSLKEEKARVGMELLSKCFERMDYMTVLGPSQALIYKKNDYYRQCLYIKSPSYESLTVIKDIIEKKVSEDKQFSEVFLDFDFNPTDSV